MTLWNAVRGLHILGAAVWVGGMFFVMIVLRPSLAVLEPAPRIALLGQILRRFFRVIWHAMPLVLITGYAMLFGLFGGFAGAPWPVHVMHGLGLLMTAVFVAVVFGPWPRFRAAVQPASAGKHVEVIRKLVLLNLVLGLVTILIAALVG